MATGNGWTKFSFPAVYGKAKTGGLANTTKNKTNLLNKGGMLCLVEMEQVRQDWVL